MIFFPDKHIAIITPPHTASRNIHEGLGARGFWVLGEDPFTEGSINHHSVKIHDAWHRVAEVADDEFKTYVVCRDPYTRLVGLFLHYECSQDNGLAKRYLCWEEFVYNRNNLNWMFNKTITDFIKASQIEDYSLIRYENLEDDLSLAIGDSVSLPPKYHELIDIKEWYCDSSLLKHVNETWAEKDCDIFGYSML